MWNGRSVSVILMTYAEKDSIRELIEGFFATGVVNEVLVVNNNAEPGTAEEIAQTRARQVFESQHGYGHACQRGLAEATGDLLPLPLKLVPLLGQRLNLHDEGSSLFVVQERESCGQVGPLAVDCCGYVLGAGQDLLDNALGRSIEERDPDER